MCCTTESAATVSGIAERRGAGGTPYSAAGTCTCDPGDPTMFALALVPVVAGTYVLTANLTGVPLLDNTSSNVVAGSVPLPKRWAPLLCWVGGDLVIRSVKLIIMLDSRGCRDD